MAGMEDKKATPAAEVAHGLAKPGADEPDSAAPGAARGDSFIAGVLGENPLAREGNPYAGYLSRSVFLEEGSPPKLVQGTTTSLTILLAGFLLFAGIIQLDERAVAPGEILPENFVQPVQHLEGGIVANFLVDEGALVKAGQPLIVLDETAPRAEYESLRARLAGLRAVEERLRAFVLNRQADFSGPAENYPELVRDQMQILA
ncbi:MAG: hypothetical protein V3R73_02745, partial [Sphingomonadales bacterium]